MQSDAAKPLCIIGIVRILCAVLSVSDSEATQHSKLSGQIVVHWNMKSYMTGKSHDLY